MDIGGMRIQAEGTTSLAGEHCYYYYYYCCCYYYYCHYMTSLAGELTKEAHLVLSAGVSVELQPLIDGGKVFHQHAVKHHSKGLVFLCLFPEALL